MKLSIGAIAALVIARRNRGFIAAAGNKGAYEAWVAGLLEEVSSGYELNLRGQDVADEAIRLAKTVKEKPR